MTNQTRMFFCIGAGCTHSGAYDAEIYSVPCPKCGATMFSPGTQDANTSNESDNPDHYKTGNLECIDVMRAMLGDEGFAAYIRGTIFKYNWRLGKKDEAVMEARKIAVYTRWLGEVLAGRELSK